MVRRNGKRAVKQNKFKSIKNFIHSNSMPLIITMTTVAILFVLIRMKGIEQDYEYNEISKIHKNEKDDNKELKAYKAKLLSVKNLKSFSNKFKLKEPKDNQVIIIPE